MAYIDWTSDCYNNNSNAAKQDLEQQLNNALMLIDRETSDFLYKITNENHSKIPKEEWISRIYNAWDYVDHGLFSAGYPAIKQAAKLVAKEIKLLKKTTQSNDPNVLVEEFYKENNLSIQAPIIRLPKHKNKAKQITNIMDAHWWFNNLIDVIEKNREHFRQLIGLINPDSPYASDCAVKNKRTADKRKKKYLDEKTVIIKSTGEIKHLSSIIKSEEQEFAETWCILRGIDEHAQLNGMPSAMITITAPSQYHPSPSNLTWLTAIDAQEFIASKWHRITKLLHRYKNQVFLFRVVEANVDGTPHWHILIYFNPDIKSRLQSKIMRTFDVDNLNNLTVKWQDTDRAKGSFLSYVAKSIVPPSLATFNKAQSGHNDRIDAFRSTWDFRAFQFLGLPTGYLKIWRLLRRKSDFKFKDKKSIELLRKIKNNDFSSFLGALITGDVVLTKSKQGTGFVLQVFSDLIDRHESETDNKNGKVTIDNNLNIDNHISDKNAPSKQLFETGIIKKTLKLVMAKTIYFFKQLYKNLTITPFFRAMRNKQDSS